MAEQLYFRIKAAQTHTESCPFPLSLPRSHALLLALLVRPFALNVALKSMLHFLDSLAMRAKWTEYLCDMA